MGMETNEQTSRWHQPEQVRIPAAGGVGLSVAVAEHGEARGALEGEGFVDHGAQLN